MTEPLYYFTVAELSEHVRSKNISPVQIVEACLARIEALNSRLNAFITVFADESRKLAREAEKDIEAGRLRGPLQDSVMSPSIPTRLARAGSRPHAAVSLASKARTG
jgi:Asp-tRNA(Asn)/Glu-tRNA(Gln) amidotransferase A subunit family amidase